MLQSRTVVVHAPFLIPRQEIDTQSISTPATEVWLFTDPAAMAIYTQKELLIKLERDIRTYAMFQGSWSSDELAFQGEIERLCADGSVTATERYGNTSPHPTFYRALKNGEMEIGGEKFHFHAGEELVFAPWPERLYRPGLCGPVRIGNFDPSAELCLCSHTYPQLDGLTPKQLAVLHQISCYPRRR